MSSGMRRSKEIETEAAKKEYTIPEKFNQRRRS